MSQSMFEYDAVLTNLILEFCRDRLALDPVPLDFGSLHAGLLPPLDSLITQDGVDPAAVLEFFRDEIAPAVVSIDSPRFLAFIPNAPTKNSLLFDMVVACSGLNGTSWLESAGVVVAENQALEFLARRCGLPPGSGGVFVSGGSIANLSALNVGRDVGRSRRPDLAPHTLRYAISADAHSSIGRSLHILGMEALLVEPSDHRFSLANLESALAIDPHPETVIGIVATSGTTNAGIIDDLDGLGSFARSNNLWFHVDGAYGAAAIFSSTLRHELDGLAYADSLIIDPHKWLFSPLDCAALLYRDPQLAKAVHTQQAGYLDVLHEGEQHEHDWNPSDYAIHLSRRARGLPFWFSLITNGVGAYENAVQAGIDLAQRTAEEIARRPYLELVRPAGLSIVLFRRLGWSAERYNEWSDELLEEQIAFVTPTKWEGETVARIAFLHPDTTDGMVKDILDTMAD